jgi:hypothetical protein
LLIIFQIKIIVSGTAINEIKLAQLNSNLNQKSDQTASLLESSEARNYNAINV